METPEQNPQSNDPFDGLTDLFESGENRDANRSYARASAAKHGLDPDFVDRLMTRESGFNPHAYNKSTGASGIGQIIPGTAKQLGLQNPFGSQENIDKSLDYLGQLHQRFKGDQRRVAAGYFAGPEAAEKALANPKGNPKTKAYADAVGGDPFEGLSDLLESGTQNQPPPTQKSNAYAGASVSASTPFSGAKASSEPGVASLSPATSLLVNRDAAGQPLTHDGYPAIKNPDGSLTTERSITVTSPKLNGGKPTNIPSVWKGKQLSEAAAIEAALKSGNGYDAFGSVDEAVAAAQSRSAAKGRELQQSAAVPPRRNDHSDKWNQEQADMYARATAAGLPETTDSRQRLLDAINRAEQAGFKTPHFIGTKHEPSGDRAVTRDVENLVASLRAQEAATPVGSQRDAISKQRAYWEREAADGMSAEEWKNQTGDPEPQYPRSKSAPSRSARSQFKFRPELEDAFNAARQAGDKAKMAEIGAQMAPLGYEVGAGDGGWTYIKRPDDFHPGASAGKAHIKPIEQLGRFQATGTQFPAIQQYQETVAATPEGTSLAQDAATRQARVPSEFNRTFKDRRAHRLNPLQGATVAAEATPEPTLIQELGSGLERVGGGLMNVVGGAIADIGHQGQQPGLFPDTPNLLAPIYKKTEELGEGMARVGEYSEQQGQKHGSGGVIGDVEQAAGETLPLLALKGGAPAFGILSYLTARRAGATPIEAAERGILSGTGVAAGGALASRVALKGAAGLIARAAAATVGMEAPQMIASGKAPEPKALLSNALLMTGMEAMHGIEPRARRPRTDDSLIKTVENHLNAGGGLTPEQFDAYHQAVVREFAREQGIDLSAPEVPPVDGVIKGQSPSELVPEPKSAIAAQLEALRNQLGSRRAVLVPTEDQMPATRSRLENEGFAVTKTPAGIFLHSTDPKDQHSISRKNIRQMVADGTYHELLGIREPKSAETTEAVVARDPETRTELQTALASREGVPDQVAELSAQHPQATVGVETPENVIAGRTASVPFMITRDQRQQLYDLGYKASDVDAMKPEEAHSILAGDQSPQIAEKPIDTAAHEAATSPTNGRPEPTEPQLEAGNYKKGHVKIGGLDISIEHPEGSKRRPEWPQLKSHYGYLRRTTGGDGEQVDLFVKPGTPEDYSGPVFVVDQAKKDGSFDEHKAMLGWSSDAEAKAGYLENYPAGWNAGPIKRFQNVADFKEWLKTGDMSKPAAAKESGAVKSATVGKLSVGDVVRHPDFAGGEPHKIVSIEGRQIGLRRVDDRGRTLTVDAASRVRRGLEPVEGKPAPSSAPEVGGDSPKAQAKAPAERAERTPAERRQTLYDQLVAARRADHAELFQDSPLSAEELDRVAKKFESLKGEVTAKRPIKAVVEDYLRQTGLFADSELNADQKDLLREMSAPQRRAPLKTQQAALFDKAPTIESKREDLERRGFVPPQGSLFQAEQSIHQRLVASVIDEFASEGVRDFKEAVSRFRDEFGPSTQYGELFEEAWDANKNVKKRGKATFDDALEPMSEKKTGGKDAADLDLVQYIRDRGGINMGSTLKGEQKSLRESRLRQPGVFNKEGLAWDDMETALRQDGFLQDGESLLDALDSAARGEKRYANSAAYDEQVEREWQRASREELAKNSDHSIMASAIDNARDEEYKPWVEAYDRLHNKPEAEDFNVFSEHSRDIGLSDQAINRLIDEANRHDQAQAERAARDEESARRGSTAPTDAASFRQGLVDNFDYSPEAADATTSVADALISTLAKESRQSSESFYKRILISRRGQGEVDTRGLDQGPLGVTQFLKTGQTIIRALENPNESTASHELVHVTTPMFMRLAEEGSVSKQFSADMAHMSRWMGFRDVAHFNGLHDRYVDAKLSGPDLKRYVDGQEKAARGFEKYLRTGKAPTPALEAAFARFKEWLSGIYQNLKGSKIDIDLGRKQQAVWDRLLGGTGEIARGGTQAKQETIQTERAQRGLADIEKEGARRWGAVWDEAKADVNTDGGRKAIRKLAEDLANKPRVLSDVEQAKLVYDRAQLKASYDQAEKKGLEALKSGDDAAAMDAEATLAYVRDKLLDNDMALFKAGTEWGRAGAIRQLLAREDYSYERQVNRAKIKKGADLNPEEKARFKELAQKYEELQTEIAARNAELESQRAYMTELQRQVVQRETVEGWRSSTRKGSARPRAQVDAEFAAMENQLARLAREANGLHQIDDITEDRFPAEVRKLIRDMARNRVEAGARTAEDVNGEVHGIVRQYFPDVTPREVAEVWSDYGRKSSLSKEELDVALREAKRQQRLISALEDAQSGEAPLRSGLQRDKQSQRVRELTREVMAEIRKQGLQTHADPEQQWKTSQEALKTRLRNAVEDLDKQIGTGEAPEPRQILKRGYDDETIALMSERDLLKRQLNDPAARNKDNLNRQLREAERKLREGDLSRSEKQAFPPEIYDDAEASRMRERVKALQKEINALRNEPRQKEKLQAGILDLQRRIRERDFSRVERETREVPPVIESLRAQRDSLAKVLREMEGPRTINDEKRIASAEKALEKSIADLDQRVREGTIAARQPRSSSPWSARLGELQNQRAGLAGILKDLRDAAKPARDPQAAALKAFKTRTEKTIADYDRRLREGDFSPRTKVRREIPHDVESTRLRVSLEQVKQDFEREQIKLEKVNRGSAAKTADFLVKWKRGVVMSSAQTLFKLSSAALQRYVTTPMEEATSMFWSHMPIVGKIAERAPREGGASFRAELNALTTLTNKALYGPEGKITEASMRTLRTGMSRLDTLYGGKHLELDPEFIDYIAHAHGALKAPAKIAEFQRAFTKRMMFEYNEGIKRGLTPEAVRAYLAEPDVQMTVGNASYQDANRAILMQDNIAVTLYRGVLATLKRHGFKGTARAMQFEFPIVKVPSNFVAETGRYIGGVPKAALYDVPKLLWTHGVENLPPEQADRIMRLFKKGSVGMALMGIGFFNPKTFGGYYQPGKREDEDLPFGGMRIGGVAIPRYLLHSAAFETIQFGATARRIYDKMIKKGESKSSALLEGATHGFVGLAEEIPFLEQPVRELGRLKQEGGFLNMVTEHVKDMLIPPDVERAAKATDPLEQPGAVNAIKRFTGFAPNRAKRAPGGLLQSVEAAVPGLRDLVPENHAAARSQSISDLTRRMRKGENVMREVRAGIESGELNRGDEKRILADSRMSPELLRFRGLDVNQAWKVYKAASAAEKEELGPSFRQKVAAAMRANPSLVPQELRIRR